MTERPFWESFRVIAKCTEMALLKPKFTGQNIECNRELWDTMLADGNITAFSNIDKSDWRMLRSLCVQYMRKLKRQPLTIATKKLLLVLLLSETLEQNMFDFIIDQDQHLSEEYILELIELGPQIGAWQMLAEQLIT